MTACTAHTPGVSRALQRVGSRPLFGADLLSPFAENVVRLLIAGRLTSDRGEEPEAALASGSLVKYTYLWNAYAAPQLGLAGQKGLSVPTSAALPPADRATDPPKKSPSAASEAVSFCRSTQLPPSRTNT